MPSGDFGLSLPLNEFLTPLSGNIRQSFDVLPILSRQKQRGGGKFPFQQLATVLIHLRYLLFKHQPWLKPFRRTSPQCANALCGNGLIDNLQIPDWFNLSGFQKYGEFD